MADEMSFLSRIGPWVASVVFGVGAGIGGAKSVISGHEKRITAVEDWCRTEGMTKELHCAKLQKAQSDNALSTERIINAANEKLAEKILTEIKGVHERIDRLIQ